MNFQDIDRLWFKGDGTFAIPLPGVLYKQLKLTALFPVFRIIQRLPGIDRERCQVDHLPRTGRHVVRKGN